MKDKTLLIKLLTVFFGMVFLIVSAFSWYYIPVMTGKSADDIFSIEIFRNNSYMCENSSYIIDFKNNTLTKSEDGETSYSLFSEENKNSFIKTANIYGFWKWEEYYTTNIYDLSSVNINIVYSDGSEQSIFCYGGTAPDYQQIRNAFYDNFGYYMM